MSQVLTERPRYASGTSYRRQRRINKRADAEHATRREAIHRRIRARDKSFSDLFGPLRRFLEANVGRPWNKVFSEICRHARLDNVAQQHLRRHVFDFVETNVVLINGVPCHGEGFNQGEPLRAVWRTILFVCPATGILKSLKRTARRRVEPPRRVAAGKWRQFHRTNAGWYTVVLRPLPDDAEGCVDALLGRRVVEIRRAERIERYGHDAYALSARPARKREFAELRCLMSDRRGRRQR